MFPRIFATWIQWVLKGIGKLLVFLLLLSAPSAVVITTVNRRWRRGAAPINPFPPPPLKSGDPRCSHSHNAGRSSSSHNTTQHNGRDSTGEGGVQRTVLLSAPNYSATTAIIPPPPSHHRLIIDYSSSRRSISIYLFDGSVALLRGSYCFDPRRYYYLGIILVLPSA